MWGKRVDDIFEALLLDKEELSEDIKKGNSLSESFLACLDECVSERESKAFWKGLDINMYKGFVKQTEFLHGLCDAGTRLLFKFRSGTHGLNEELGRHRGREGKVECSICGAECESVVHVLWECPAYSSCREGFKATFKELIGDSFEQLSDIDKTAYVLGSELWEENFEDTFRLVKEFLVDVWEVRKQKLYGEDACHQCQTLAGDAGPVTGGGGLRVSKLGKLQDRGKLGKLGKFHVQVCVMCMLVIVAPPIVLGAWLMAFLLGQHVEYLFTLTYRD